MTEVAQGTSLARFGHGEFLIMDGKDAEHQKYDEMLSALLGDILKTSSCLVAVPPHDPPGWQGFLTEYGRGIERDRWYGSSFVSRHDWVPWTRAYRRLIYSLWEKRIVTLVAPENIRLKKAHAVFHVKAPSRDAFDAIDDLDGHAQYMYCANDTFVILSCGSTATVLADRLARKGIWAVDLGNFGKFL